jgi:ABC-2 type transport system permease protein
MTAATAAGKPAGWMEPFHPEFPLFHYIWKLFRLQFAISWSSFRTARLRRKIGTIFIAIMIAAFAAGIFVFSWFLLGLLRSPELAQILAEQGQLSLTPFLESVPILVLAGSFFGILVTSFGVLLSALYLSGDMEFLMSAPVPIRAVFLTKQLQAILPNFGFIALFGLPLLLGLGASGGYNFLYYPMVVIALAMLALAAAGVSSLLVMGVVRIFPARRVAEVLGAAGAMFSIICSQSGNFVNLMRPDEKNLDAQLIPFAALTRFNSAWNPLAWPGRGLVELGESRFLPALLFLGLTLLLAGGVFLLSLRVAERLYYSGWASMQVGGRKKRAALKVRHPSAVLAGRHPGGILAGTDTHAKQDAPARTGAGASFLAEFIPQPVLGLVRKDFLNLSRDPRNMSQLISPIMVGVMYLFFLFRSGGAPLEGQGDAPEWFMQIIQTAMIYGNVGVSLFVSWSLISRLGMIGFSQEGRNYWMLKASPVGPIQLLAAKFLVAYLPGLLLGSLFMLVISLIRSTSVSMLLFGLAVVALSIIGAAGVNVAFGVVGVNLTWDDPRRMTSGMAGCISVPASMLYMGIVAMLFFGPPVLLPALGLPEWAGQLIGLALGATFSLACAAVSLGLVKNRVPRIGEG